MAGTDENPAPPAHSRQETLNQFQRGRDGTRNALEEQRRLQNELTREQQDSARRSKQE